jgi:uncharacterized protein with NRDE domain
LRVPPFDRYQRLLSGMGLMLAGAIIGSAIFMSIYHRNYNLMYIKMHNYQEENKKHLQDIDSLKKTRNNQTLVSFINVYLQNPENEEVLSENIQKEIESIVKKELKLVIGQKATYVRDAQILYEKLISQKILTIDNKNYTVQVKSIILVQTELTVWITAKEKRA